MGGRLGQTIRKQKNFIAVGGVWSLHSNIPNHVFLKSESSPRLREQKEFKVGSGS